VSSFAARRDDSTAAFYDAAAEGRLLVRSCPVCSTLHPPQTRRCRDSDRLEWVEVSGRAKLVTWAVDHSPPLCPELARADARTSLYGIVELDEGPWMQVAIVGADEALLGEGTAMRVTFVRPGGGEAVPVFTPA